jgi:hypothetical protein
MLEEKNGPHQQEQSIAMGNALSKCLEVNSLLWWHAFRRMLFRKNALLQ